MRAKLYDEWVPVYEIVDVDGDDHRVYVKTHPNSDVFCVPYSDVEIEYNPTLKTECRMIVFSQDEMLIKNAAAKVGASAIIMTAKELRESEPTIGDMTRWAYMEADADLEWQARAKQEAADAKDLHETQESVRF